VQIALVEDDELVRSFVVELLTERGYRVRAFGETQAAYEALSDFPPGLLLCDVELPDGSGLDLVARLRALHGDALPVLMMSGLTRESDIIRGFAAGATDYLPKPIKSAELLAKISVMLSRAGRVTSPVPGGEVLPGGAEAAFGRYRLQGVLGRGSFGIVFRAHDTLTDRAVALKVLGALVTQQQETRMRFLRETYALASVRHENVVAVHDFGAAEGRLYYTMDLVAGPSVEARVRQRPATEAEAVHLLRGVARGLVQLEKAGILHRDLKPANVILRELRWESPVIVDFGLAKQPFDRGLTDPNMILGTPGYMAPETILGRPVDHRADLFSLGLLARFALTATEAFADLSGLRLLNALATRPVDLPPAVSPQLRGVLRRLLALDAARRTPSAGALLDELDRLS
jgi:DNA-binding response OmpR family regulator